MKGKASIPASHHVQTAELVQVEKGKAELVQSLEREREAREKLAEKITTLQSRLTELQNTWDNHSCPPATAPPETSSLAEQLNTKKAANDVLEKHAITARQRITDLEGLAAENGKRIETLQKEIEQEKKTKAD